MIKLSKLYIAKKVGMEKDTAKFFQIIIKIYFV